MTLRIVTYDDSKFKIVPLEATEEMIIAGDIHVDGLTILHDCYEAMIAAAPEYKESEWFLVLIAILNDVGLASLIYWVWKSDKSDKNRSQ